MSPSIPAQLRQPVYMEQRIDLRVFAVEAQTKPRAARLAQLEVIPTPIGSDDAEYGSVGTLAQGEPHVDRGYIGCSHGSSSFLGPG
jgi:hypothetical protein